MDEWELGSILPYGPPLQSLRPVGWGRKVFLLLMRTKVRNACAGYDTSLSELSAPALPFPLPQISVGRFYRVHGLLFDLQTGQRSAYVLPCCLTQTDVTFPKPPTPRPGSNVCHVKRVCVVGRERVWHLAALCASSSVP